MGQEVVEVRPPDELKLPLFFHLQWLVTALPGVIVQVRWWRAWWQRGWVHIRRRLPARLSLSALLPSWPCPALPAEPLPRIPVTLATPSRDPPTHPGLRCRASQPWTAPSSTAR